MFSAFVSPLFFEPVGCRHVGLDVFLVRAACNDPGCPSVACRTVEFPNGPTLPSAIDYRLDAILGLMMYPDNL